MAKDVIRLILGAAKTINADPATRDLLQIVFPENYNVTVAEMLIPAADLSEQISTAGKEASGTGNMKLGLNGAVTIGTLDGANVEMREHVGAENFYLFGLTAAEADAKRSEPGFARKAIEQSPRMMKVLAQMAEGRFSDGDRDSFGAILHNLWEHDYFLVSCDFDDYFSTQRLADIDFADQRGWAKKAALNTARLGWFSSDRTIRGYMDDIWNAEVAAPLRKVAAE